MSNTVDIIQVALINMGERIQVDLDFLAKKLNSLQSSFEFTVVNPITMAKIGEPNIIQDDSNTWYEFEALFNLLRGHECFSKYNYLIGITHLTVTERSDTDGKNCGDYFSLSDFQKVAVLSLSHDVLKYSPPSKTPYQYLSYLISGEILIMYCKKNLIHATNNFCLFDDCVNRSLFGRCIETVEICEECLYRLKKANVSEKMISDVMAVLKWCKSDNIKYSIVETLRHPVTLLCAGTGLGWLGAVFIKPINYPFILCALFITPALVFISKKYSRKNF